jgi:hypothetical protein
MRYFVPVTGLHTQGVDPRNIGVNNRLRHASEHPIWVKRKEPTCSKPCNNVSWGEGFRPCRTEEGSEMLFADCIDASALQPLDLLPVSGLQGCEHGDVAGLKLVRSMRRETTQDYVVC